MKLNELKVGQKVYDAWWPWEIGVVKKILNTRILVSFSVRDVRSYDVPHLQFLRTI